MSNTNAKLLLQPEVINSVAKAKKLVVAVFEKPTKCRECPCYAGSPGYQSDVCALRNKIIDRYDPNPIPDWCPLTDVNLAFKP